MFGTLISSVTVGAGGASTIDFTSIPGTYSDIYLLVCARTSVAAVDDGVVAWLNGDTTGANYSRRWLLGNGSAVSSNAGANLFYMGMATAANATASTFGNSLAVIPNYAGGAAKTSAVDLVSETNAAAATQAIYVSNWTGTAAITSISLRSLSAGTFQQYSTAYLYGTLKGSGGATVA